MTPLPPALSDWFAAKGWTLHPHHHAVADPHDNADAHPNAGASYQHPSSRDPYRHSRGITERIAVACTPCLLWNDGGAKSLQMSGLTEV